jgi:hypothetical protein
MNFRLANPKDDPELYMGVVPMYESETMKALMRLKDFSPTPDAKFPWHLTRAKKFGTV